MLQARLNALMARRSKIDAEIDELRGLLGLNRRRSRLVPPECGTESGYQRHRHYRETCDECRAAHAAHERARVARLRDLEDASYALPQPRRQLPRPPKVEALSDAAYRLHGAAMFYAARFQLDGYLTTANSKARRRWSRKSPRPSS
jgi:hypothetical protein